MADLGEVKPIYGRWHWPFRQMQVGDEFFVRYENRAPEDARQLASVRAAQLGIRLSCRKDDEAGVLKVMRIDADNRRALPEKLDYEQVKALLRSQYGLDAEDVPWQSACDEGEMLRSRARRIGDDPRRVVEADVAGHRYALELLGDELVATHLGARTLQSWKDAKLLAMME